MQDPDLGASDARDNEKVIVCNREDGLGERLRALCNAMAVADFLGVDFRFQWDAIRWHAELHSVQPAEATFTADFVRDHRVDKVVEGDYAALVRPPYTPAGLRSLMDGAGKGIFVQQYPLHYMMDRRAQPDWPQRFRSAFDRLPFVPAVEAARQRALNADMPAQPVAVHLRAGDIVYGEHRLRGRFGGKVVTYPIAKRLIGDLIREGKTPVIFGQDMDTCRLLADHFGLKLAVDILDLGDAPALEAAVADIVLMSRCERIIAGNSGFALIASELSMAPHTDPIHVFSPEETADIILAEPDMDNPDSGVPDLQKAFAWFTAYRLSVGVRSDDELLDILAKAVRCDRRNAWYRLVRATIYISQRQVRRAENELERMVTALWAANRPMTDSILYIALPKGRGRVEEAAGVLDVLKRFAVKPDRPWVNLFLGMLAYANRDTRRAVAHFAQSPAALPGNPYTAGIPEEVRPPVAAVT